MTTRTGREHTLIGAERAVVKTSRGRTTTGLAKVPHVEDLPCPHGGLHVLTNSERLTLCAKCGTAWSVLDAAARAGVGRA